MTYLLGLIAIEHPMVAAGGAVVVTVLRAERRRLHEFSVHSLSESELRDGLIFAAAALILLPLLSNQAVPWLAGGNPRRLVVLFLALQATGYVASRAAGPRIGLAVSGLAAGFVSSTGTIAALGTRSRQSSALRAPCVAGALFSAVATVILLAVVVLAVCPSALLSLAPSLACALAVIVCVACLSLWHQRGKPAPELPKGRAFSLLYALGFAASLTGVTALVSVASKYFGTSVVGVTAAVAGAFDVHALAASTLSLVANGTLAIGTARLSILAALSAITLSKVIAAFGAGGWAYGIRVTIGLLATLAGAWAPLWWVT